VLQLVIAVSRIDEAALQPSIGALQLPIAGLRVAEAAPQLALSAL
jgi:hypothetical protein